MGVMSRTIPLSSTHPAIPTSSKMFPSVGPSDGYTAETTLMEHDSSHTTASVSNTHVNVGQVAAVGVHINGDSVETPSLRCSVHTKSWQPGCTVCDQALLLSSKATAVDPRKMAVADRLLGRKSTKPAHAVELGSRWPDMSATSRNR